MLIAQSLKQYRNGNAHPGQGQFNKTSTALSLSFPLFCGIESLVLLLPAEENVGLEAGEESIEESKVKEEMLR